MAEKKQTSKRRIGTIQSTALILAILSLIILLRIYPDLNKNVDETSSMIADLRARLDATEVKLEMINRRVCATQYDAEILKLKRAVTTLDDVVQRSSGDIAIQAVEIQKMIHELILQLQKETVSAASSQIP